MDLETVSGIILITEGGLEESEAQTQRDDTQGNQEYIETLGADDEDDTPHEEADGTLVAKQPNLQNKFKSPLSTPNSSNVNKRRRKFAPAAKAFIDSCEAVSSANKELVGDMRGESHNSSATTIRAEHPSEFVEAFGQLNELVEMSLIKRKSDLWCYGPTEMSKKNRRDVFLILNDADEKKTWLDHEYKMMLAHLPR